MDSRPCFLELHRVAKWGEPHTRCKELNEHGRPVALFPLILQVSKSKRLPANHYQEDLDSFNSPVGYPGLLDTLNPLLRATLAQYYPGPSVKFRRSGPILPSTQVFQPHSFPAVQLPHYQPARAALPACQTASGLKAEQPVVTPDRRGQPAVIFRK